MLPNTHCQFTRRNRSLLENLLPLFQTSDEIDGQEKPKKFNKFIFRNICKRYNIINEKHYQECLKSVNDLQECEVSMNPSQLEGYKKLIFIHNFKRIPSTFTRPQVFQIGDRNRLGICCRFIKTVALENGISFDNLAKQLTRWYFVRNHKKYGIILYGTTNSGKTLFADLLCSQYKDWEIGAFSCPPGINVSQFHLDALLNTFLYRCDEMIFENICIVQRMKNLLEGSRLMDTDVKYKSKQQIPPNPTIISMNGKTEASIFKWCHEELEPFKGRCLFLKMNIPLHHRVGSGAFKYLGDSGKEFIYILTKTDLSSREDEVVNTGNYINDICIS